MDEICGNRVIFLDGGSTNYLAAQSFPHDWEGTVITNSPAAAPWMSDYDHVEVNMLPGTMNHKSKRDCGFNSPDRFAAIALRLSAAR